MGDVNGGPTTWDENAAEPEQLELKRAMGPGLLLLFIIGDVLGTGIYALIGQIAGEVGGASWLPLLLSFVVAMLTAGSYLELVTKYPQAAGAGLYVHKAFRKDFLTFIVVFIVMCSGLTSACASARAFAANLMRGATGHDEQSNLVLLGISAAFMIIIMLLNLRGVSQGLYTNLVLTLIEVSGLLLVIFIALWAALHGQGDWSRTVIFSTGQERGAFMSVSAATSLAFFAMVGFEDSVNMAEETRDPSRTFPKIMFAGLSITAVVYVTLALLSVALVPVGTLSASETPLVAVVEHAAPGFPINQFLPWLSMFAVANTSLINMMMASRLIYGLARQGVIPAPLGRVSARHRVPWVAVVSTTVLALGLLTYVNLAQDTPVVALLGGTTSLLLLLVFTLVNVVVLVLRKDHVDHEHFRTNAVVAVVAAVCCLYLALPISGREPGEYAVAIALTAIGIALWILNWLLRRRRTGIDETPSSIQEEAAAR